MCVCLVVVVTDTTFLPLQVQERRTMKLAPSATCSCGPEDQTATACTAQLPTSADGTKKKSTVCPTAVLLHSMQTQAATFDGSKKKPEAKRPHTSCRLHFQCSGDKEEHETLRMIIYSFFFFFFCTSLSLSLFLCFIFSFSVCLSAV